MDNIINGTSVTVDLSPLAKGSDMLLAVLDNITECMLGLQDEYDGIANALEKLGNVRFHVEYAARELHDIVPKCNAVPEEYFDG